MMMKSAFTRKLLFAGFLAALTSSFFWSGEHPKAGDLNIKQETAHWIWPANGIITDSFGTRRGEHKGIDIASTVGTPIYAVDGGIVSKSYYSRTYGNVVFIKHNNHFETVYAHLKSRNVTEGKVIKQGEVIGSMGNTGDSSGVHLHFEIHQNEWTFDKLNAINPVSIFDQVVIGQYVYVNSAKALEVSGH
jgi:murein DD-endopeptidase MepM/ murein hydrolase activator NlpD